MSARILVIAGWIIIAAPAAAQVTVFEESFDGAGAPVGWTLEDGWTLSTSTPSSGSGLSSLQHKGNAAAAATTPEISLSGAVSASLTYLVRRTGAYGADNLVVKGSADGGASFGVTLLEAGSAVPATDSKWEMITVAVPAGLLGSSEVVVRFEGQGLYASGATARIDDVMITADVPVEVAPLSLSFAAPVEASDIQSFTAVNRTSETATLAAPVLSGSGFSIDPSGSVDLAAGASQDYEVTFTASSQGTFVGSVHLDYGSGAAVVALSGTGSGGLLSFAEAASTTFEDEIGLAVPLRLAFSAVAGLQGLQFRVAWAGDAPLSASGIERGAAISSTGEWSVSHETGSGYVDVVLLGEGAASLAGGTYDDVLSILFDVGSVESEAAASLTLQNVIGALAEPDGSDADLSAAEEAHVITIEPKHAFFEASASSLDLGVASAGERSTATLTVSNPGGNSDLVIEEITTSNPLFSVAPTTAQIAPDGAQEFTITFTPTTTSFGRQNTEVTFVHNGMGGSDVISLTGKGRGGRGDAEGDGTVDVLDVVHAIDFVLARLTPDAAQKAAADLFPFPDGDADLDVRDLTVLSQAIVRGRWPDDVDLPLEEIAAGKTESSGILLTVDPLLIEMTFDAPIRAFQILLPAVEDAAVDVEASARGEGAPAGGATIVFGVRAASTPAGARAGGGPWALEHELRVLVYRPDGAVIPPGVLRLFTSGVTGRPRYVTVIGERRDRLRVDASVWTSAEEALPSTVLPQKPYPNPLRAGSDMLRISVDAGVSNVTVYDLLGRLIRRLEGPGEVLEWDGADATGRPVGSGLYFVRTVSVRDSHTYAIQVIR